MAITNLILMLIIWLISAIPLYIAVKMLGGKTTFLKVLAVNLLVAILVIVLNSLLGWWAGIVAFILMLFIYKMMFRIGWIRAFLAWLLQFVIIAIFVVLFGLLGISLLAASLL